MTAKVIALTALSALSLGGAKIITAQKVDTAQNANQSPAKTSAAQPNLMTDLIQSDLGQADFGDLQMILVTVAAVAI